MQSLMSNLLASAAGKQEFTPPGTYQFHPDSFIIPGEYRQEHCNIDDPETPTRQIHFYSPSESNLPSYVPCYDVSGYSSSPTYVRGDFYNISPPESPDLSVPRNQVSTNQDQRLTFSIDTILGTESSDLKTSSTETKEQECSATTTSRTSCSSGELRFSMSDWSIFQNCSRQTVYQSACGQSVYWCHVCDMSYSTLEVATSHQIAHFNNGKSCRLQRKHFLAHGYVSTHQETDYLNRIKCGLCDRIVTKCFFSKHLRCHDGHICDVCGHETSTNSLLLTHMKNHREHRPYSCRVCSRKFGDRNQLATHELSHRKGGHQCKFCGKMFCSKYTRVVHERVHTGYNPYVCRAPGCNRSFPQKVQLKMHMCTHY